MPNYRLKLARVNNLKLRVSPRIPAQISGGSGIDVVRTNALYTVNLDFEELTEQLAIASDLEATTFLALHETIGDSYSRISLTNLKADISATFDGLYQPLDAELTAIAGLTSAANKLPYFTGSETAALADFTAYGRSIVAVADEAAFKALVNLEIGTDVQAFDADLGALAANSTNGLWARTGAGTGAARTLTAPAAGLTITNPAGTAGNPTFALANDLAALEGLGSTGIARRTGSDAWSVGTAVANSELATMGAYTFKMNATGGAATPTDVEISTLTTKASPAAGDYVLISDQDASGQVKKATVSSVASAGSVSSIAGNTGAFTLGQGLANDTNVLRVAAGVPIQVVQSVNTTNQSTASTSYVTSNVSVTITPASSSNTVRVQATGIVGADAGAGVFLTLFRGVTDLTPSGTTELQGFVVTNNADTRSFVMDFIDSPATTSATTYTIYWKVNTSTGRMGRRGVDTLFDSPTIITATEIKG